MSRVESEFYCSKNNYLVLSLFHVFCVNNLSCPPSPAPSSLGFSMAPAARMAMTRRVRPLVSLNPYEGSWTIKVRLTNKGNMRTYKNARGEGCVFNVELTDEDVRDNCICVLCNCFLLNSDYS